MWDENSGARNRRETVPADWWHNTPRGTKIIHIGSLLAAWSFLLPKVIPNIPTWLTIPLQVASALGGIVALVSFIAYLADYVGRQYMQPTIDDVITRINKRIKAADTQITETATKVQKRMSSSVKGAVRTLIYDEVAGAVLREWSLLTYFGLKEEGDSAVAEAFRRLHLRNQGERYRNALATLLCTFSVRSLSDLKFSCTEEQYVHALDGILSCKGADGSGHLFDRVWWTCPFSPVFHYFKNKGNNCVHWDKFAAYPKKAKRIVCLPPILFDYLLCANEITFESKFLAHAVRKQKGRPGACLDWLISVVDNSKVTIRVREALRRFLDAAGDTETYFATGKTHGHEPLFDDYGIYWVNNRSFLVSWHPKNRCAHIRFDPGEEYKKPFMKVDNYWDANSFIRHAENFTTGSHEGQCVDSPLEIVDKDAISLIERHIAEGERFLFGEANQGEHR